MSSGEKLFELGWQHIGEAYNAGVMVPMNEPDWQGPWDCAEFASWLVFQCSGILYGTKSKTDPFLSDAYTGYWGEQAEADNATISVERAAGIVGAFLLRKPLAGKRGHIVISDGRGGTVEAYNKVRGVAAGSLTGREFDYGILVPCIAYDLPECTPVLI
ncbi:MAG: hypothetical protein MI863_10445 [Desulfobacterales bacterium]|nr:hypothetical protein [Desulfobacterales bacterium]